jgi:hypothetical protein
MPTVADYDVLQDGPVLLSAAAGQDSDRDFPIEVTDPEPGPRAVLSYMIDPGPSGVTFDMAFINGLSVSTNVVPSNALPSGAGHARQEVFSGNLFTPAGDNLRVRVTAGSAHFSDIVIMHQRTI